MLSEVNSARWARSLSKYCWNCTGTSYCHAVPSEKNFAELPRRLETLFWWFAYLAKGDSPSCRSSGTCLAPEWEVVDTFQELPESVLGASLAMEKCRMVSGSQTLDLHSQSYFAVVDEYEKVVSFATSARRIDPKALPLPSARSAPGRCFFPWPIVEIAGRGSRETAG